MGADLLYDRSKGKISGFFDRFSELRLPSVPSCL